ncbi:MAG: hypothetical protein Q7S56_03860 [Nanoarchaeota archaeon]|nr:hypothetical protein [Nanoarchaeota archaeon]
MEIQVGKTCLIVPHQEGERTFQYPAFRGNYGSVAEAIDKDTLGRPISSETASLVYDAFQNKKGEYESQIINLLKDAFLWEFIGNLYLPKSNEELNNGVILENNPQIINGRLNMDKQSLVKRLQSNDPLVKFVPFGYKIGTQKPKELGKNPYIVARYGEEGAQKISEVASKYKVNPHLFSFESVDEEKTRSSALNRGWDWYFVGRLDVIGSSWGDNWDGHAFGVCAPKESE